VKLLLIEDSQRLQTSLTRALKKVGYSVDVSGDGEDGLWRARQPGYDAIILDLMLPKVDGLTILRRLRTEGAQTHILILTARDTVEDRVKGLASGADDYLVKPFAIDELLARVQALCRRSYGSKATDLAIGDMRVNMSTRTVMRGGRVIELAAREYRLLEYLALRRGEVVSRADIETHIYDSEVEPMSNVVDSAISILRKKTTPPGFARLIHTRRGLGYMLEALE